MTAARPEAERAVVSELARHLPFGSMPRKPGTGIQRLHPGGDPPPNPKWTPRPQLRPTKFHAFAGKKN